MYSSRHYITTAYRAESRMLILVVRDNKGMAKVNNQHGGTRKLFVPKPAVLGHVHSTSLLVLGNIVFSVSRWLYDLCDRHTDTYTYEGVQAVAMYRIWLPRALCCLFLGSLVLMWEDGCFGNRSEEPHV